MAALKDHISPRMVQALADELAAAWPDFPGSAFAVEANQGLQDLELKARIGHVAAALANALPDDAERVVEIFDTALTSESFEGWMVWPCAELAGRLGPSQPDVVVPFLARLTHRMSCEFAIRPCIEQHPDLTFGFLRQWVSHPDEHVRRLVSEGTRPRLPWGERLRTLQQDPAPTIALLERLRDDGSEYVRRSVANHLGDIVKDHPELALATARRWKAEGGRYVDEVVRRGLRTLIKAGDPAALQLVGYDADAPVRLERLTVDPGTLAIGGKALITLRLVTDAAAPVPVVAEYLVHYLGVRGTRKPKAYRLGEATLEPGVVCGLERRHTFAHASIRTLYPGDHLVEVQINGRVLGSCHIELTDAPALPPPRA